MFGRSDAHPRRRSSPSGTGSSIEQTARRPAIRWSRSSRSRGVRSSRARMGRRPRDAAEAHFTRVVREGRDARRRARGARCPTAIPCTCPRCSSPPSGSALTSEARRLIEQGGVKLNDEVVTELDVPRERLVGALLQAGKRRYRAVSCGVSAFVCYHAPAASQEACKKPANRQPETRQSREDTTYVSPSTRGLRCDPEAFFGPQQNGCGL